MINEKIGNRIGNQSLKRWKCTRKIFLFLAALARAWEFKSPLGHKGKLTDVDFCLFFQFSSVVNTRGHHLWKFLSFYTGKKTFVGTYGIKMLSESSEPAKKSPAAFTTGDHTLLHRRANYATARNI